MWSQKTPKNRKPTIRSNQFLLIESLTTDDCIWTNENELRSTKIDHQAIGGNSPSARGSPTPFPQLSFRTCRFSVESWQISGGKNPHFGGSSQDLDTWLIAMVIVSPLSRATFPFQMANSWLRNGGYDLRLTGMILQVSDCWSGHLMDSKVQRRKKSSLPPAEKSAGRWGFNLHPERSGATWVMGPLLISGFLSPSCTLFLSYRLSIRTLDPKPHLTHCCIFLLNPSTSCSTFKIHYIHSKNLKSISSTHRIWQFVWSFWDGENIESPWHWLHKNNTNQKKHSRRCTRNDLSYVQVIKSKSPKWGINQLPNYN